MNELGSYSPSLRKKKVENVVSDLESKLLQVKVIRHVAIHSLTNDARSLLAEPLLPFSVEFFFRFPGFALVCQVTNAA